MLRVVCDQEYPCRWASTPNSAYGGSQSDQGVMTLEKCQSTCLADPLCVAIDYPADHDPFTHGCWHNYDEDESPGGYDSAIDWNAYWYSCRTGIKTQHTTNTKQRQQMRLLGKHGLPRPHGRTRIHIYTFCWRKPQRSATEQSNKVKKKKYF